MGDAESDLSYCANQVEDAGVQLKGDGGHTAYYVLRCSTPAGQRWGVAKRFSQFSALLNSLSEDADFGQQVYGLPFPAKTWFGGGNDEATVQQRREVLTTWVNAVLMMCPGDRDVMSFLAEDGSVQREDIGLLAQTPPKAAKPPPSHAEVAALDPSLMQVLDAEFTEAARPQVGRSVEELVNDLSVPFMEVLQASADAADNNR